MPTPRTHDARGIFTIPMTVVICIVNGDTFSFFRDRLLLATYVLLATAEETDKNV